MAEGKYKPEPKYLESWIQSRDRYLGMLLGSIPTGFDILYLEKMAVHSAIEAFRCAKLVETYA